MFVYLFIRTFYPLLSCLFFDFVGGLFFLVYLRRALQRIDVQTKCKSLVNA